MSVQITISGSVLSVASPYNSNFVAAAKRLGGKWSNGAWVFDARDEQRVRDLCRTTYGTDGVASDLVTLRMSFREEARGYCEAVEICGRTVARATGRDSGARLGDGIVLLQGSIGSGGSAKNWETRVAAGSVVLVRDFPRAEAERLIAKMEAGQSKRDYAIEPETPAVDREALAAERARLVARIAEIDALLA